MSSKPPRAVKEPVQVYLTSADRELLERAAKQSGLARAEVLRQGLRRYAADLLVDQSPVLAFLDGGRAPDGEVPADVADRHDEYLADWDAAARASAPRGARRARRKR